MITGKMLEMAKLRVQFTSATNMKWFPEKKFAREKRKRICQFKISLFECIYDALLRYGSCFCDSPNLMQ